MRVPSNHRRRHLVWIFAAGVLLACGDDDPVGTDAALPPDAAVEDASTPDPAQPPDGGPGPAPAGEDGSVGPTDGGSNGSADAATADAAAPEPPPCEVPIPTACPSPMPTFADVEPIIEERCVVCHYGMENGPWPLTSYGHVADWHDIIRAVMLNCAMPPPASGMTMPVSERVKVLEWLRCGYPR